MTIIVETGTIVPNANSYVSTADLTAYAIARDITLVGDPESLLIQAMDYIETQQYQGSKLSYTQGLQWPRVNVFIDGWYHDSNTIPKELKNGEMETAIAIDQGTAPDANIERFAIMEKVGDLQVQYAANAPSNTINKKIQNWLYKLLAGGGAGGLKVSKA